MACVSSSPLLAATYNGTRKWAGDETMQLLNYGGWIANTVEAFTQTPFTVMIAA